MIKLEELYVTKRNIFEGIYDNIEPIKLTKFGNLYLLTYYEKNSNIKKYKFLKNINGTFYYYTLLNYHKNQYNELISKILNYGNDCNLNSLTNEIHYLKSISFEELLIELGLNKTTSKKPLFKIYHDRTGFYYILSESLTELNFDIKDKELLRYLPGNNELTKGFYKISSDEFEKIKKSYTIKPYNPKKLVITTFEEDNNQYISLFEAKIIFNLNYELVLDNIKEYNKDKYWRLNNQQLTYLKKYYSLTNKKIKSNYRSSDTIIVFYDKNGVNYINRKLYDNISGLNSNSSKYFQKKSTIKNENDDLVSISIARLKELQKIYKVIKKPIIKKIKTNNEKDFYYLKKYGIILLNENIVNDFKLDLTESYNISMTIINNGQNIEQIQGNYHIINEVFFNQWLNNQPSSIQRYFKLDDINNSINLNKINNKEIIELNYYITSDNDNKYLRLSELNKYFLLDSNILNNIVEYENENYIVINDELFIDLLNSSNQYYPIITSCNGKIEVLHK